MSGPKRALDLFGLLMTWIPLLLFFGGCALLVYAVIQMFL